MNSSHEMRWASLHVRSKDADIQKHREDACARVLEFFEQNTPIPVEDRVLCFLDDRDLPNLKVAFGGVANRGVHWPIRGQGLGIWPTDMWNVIAPPDNLYGETTWPFASVVYLHGGTCQNDIGLTLSLAHELQHFMQFVNARSLWAVNALLGSPDLPTEDLKVPWDLPVEKDSRVLSKRVAESIFGKERVEGYISDRINARITDLDAQDWEFVKGIDPFARYDAAAETRTLVHKYRSSLKQLQLAPKWLQDPDVSTIDFDGYG
jgi:hypothetical protein